jgi:hypothetical protein
VASKADIDQWIAAQGGPSAVKYGYEDVEVDNPAFNNPDHPAYQGRVNTPDKVKTRRETWTNPTTGATYSVVRTPYASDQFQDIKETPGTKPAAGNEGPPGGKQFIDDGPEAGQAGRRWGWNPQTKAYDRDIGASPAAQQPQKPTTGEVRKPVANRPGYTEVTTTDATTGKTETHYEDANGTRLATLPAEPGGSVRKPVQGRPGIYEVTTKNAQTNATETHYENEAGQTIPTPTELPGSVRKPVQGKPGIYEVTTKDPTTNAVETHYEDDKGARVPTPAEPTSPYTTVHFDPDTRKWWGLTKAGTWEEMPGGGPGTQPANQTAGPPLPTIILGHSQDALRAYQAQLDAEVAAGRMTPAQRTARWNEALQMAQQTITEATLQQRENESNLNASVNLATNRLSNATSGFNSALDFVSKMNDKLPVGSSLGGQAFAAILGLQVMQAQKMGAYDNIVPGSQPSAFGRGGDTAATAADTSATQAMQPQTAMPASAEPAQAESDRQQQLAANPVFRPAPPTNVQPGAAPAEAPPVSMTGPASTASPDDMVTIESASGMRMQAPRHMVGEGPGKYSADPAKGGFHIVNEAPAGPVSQVPASQEEFAVLAQARQNEPPGIPLAPPDSGGYANPDLRYPNDYGRPPAGSEVDQEGVTRTNDRFIPPLRPTVPWDRNMPTDPMAQGAPDAMPAALLHTQARITPPWRLTPAQIQQMLAAGVPPETIWSTPGRMSA